MLSNTKSGSAQSREPEAHWGSPTRWWGGRQLLEASLLPFRVPISWKLKAKAEMGLESRPSDVGWGGRGSTGPSWIFLLNDVSAHLVGISVHGCYFKPSPARIRFIGKLGSHGEQNGSRWTQDDVFCLLKWYGLWVYLWPRTSFLLTESQGAGQAGLLDSFRRFLVSFRSLVRARLSQHTAQQARDWLVIVYCEAQTSFAIVVLHINMIIVIVIWFKRWVFGYF